MWIRAEIKKRAWNGLKNYYWYAVLCGILLGLLGSLSIIPWLIGAGLLKVCICLSPITPFLGYIIDGIYADILEVGEINYYLRSIKDRSSAPVSTIFSGFKSGYYGNSAKILIFRNIFQFLWSLLFVFPGIVKSYEYRMIPYLVADFPEKGQDEVFAISKQMMTGNKWKVFVFDLSFIGWHILSILTLGLGLIFILPYYNAACTELYLAFREEYMGIPRGNSQNGGHPGISEGNHVIYQPQNQRMLPGNGQMYMDDDDSPTVDIQNYGMNAGPAYGMPVLVGIQGEYAGAVIPIEPGQRLIVGRDSTRCNVILSSPQVSRLHMTVEYTGNKFIVVDHSTYGTFDLERGQLPKEQSMNVPAGVRLRLGNGDEVFQLELRS